MSLDLMPIIDIFVNCYLTIQHFTGVSLHDSLSLISVTLLLESKQVYDAAVAGCHL